MRVWICRLCRWWNPPDDCRCTGCGIARFREPKADRS